MKILALLLCLLAACCAGPINNRTLNVTESYFKDEYVIYTGQHDIVKIFVPFNKNNFESNYPHSVFFVEADINNGEQNDKGIYVYKDGKATKVHENGRDVTATFENVVYFGASDGIYKYNEGENSAVKHGEVTDNIVQLADNNATNTIYYLTANHEVFKLNDEATGSTKVPDVKDVRDFVFGFEGNMYYVDSAKNVYVYNNAEPKKVVGLPNKVDKLTLIAPLNGIDQGSVLVADKVVYIIKPDATVTREIIQSAEVTLDVDLTAFGPQPTMIQFYAKDKKLYRFNLFNIVKKYRELNSRGEVESVLYIPM